MRKRAVLAATSVLLSGIGAAPFAPVAQAQNYTVRNECENAVTDEVRRQAPQAGRVGFNGGRERQISNAETGYSGNGSFQDRSGRTTSFSFDCTYNVRTGDTYGVSARLASSSSGGKGGGGAAAGAILGALVVGAIVAGASSKKHHDDDYRNGWFSPAEGVQCSRREAACYKYGNFSSKWTRRVFG